MKDFDLKERFESGLKTHNTKLKPPNALKQQRGHKADSDKSFTNILQAIHKNNFGDILL